MKRVYSFPWVLLAILIMTSLSCKGQTQKESKSTPAIEVIHKRSSIRSYLDKEVTKEQLETIVRAGMAAPTAMNRQPWQFIIIQDKNILQALGKSLRTSDMLLNAPAAIVVCGDLHQAADGWLQQYWIQDCSAASENILLAITDLGLGGVWTSVYPAPERIKEVTKLLSLPEYLVPLNIIPVGYPDEPQNPKDKWNPAKVHWNKFSE